MGQGTNLDIKPINFLPLAADQWSLVSPHCSMRERPDCRSADTGRTWLKSLRYALQLSAVLCVDVPNL